MEAAVKQRRSVIKRQKKEAANQANKNAGVVAMLNNVPTSTRKMRLVADLVRGQKVNIALSILKFQAKQGAARLEKLLLAAIADWQAKFPDAKLEDADLYVKEIFVDGGRILKRLRPAPQGRAHRVRKRSNHVTLVLDSAVSELSKMVEMVENNSEPEKSTKKAPKSETKKTTKKTDNK